MDHRTPPPSIPSKRKASPTPPPQPSSGITTWNAINSAASTPTPTPASRSSTASRNSTAGRRKKKPTPRSNFAPQHDNILETVTNATTCSTTRDWKPDTSPVVLSSKASQAAYKGWQSRRSRTTASSPAGSSPAGFATPGPAPAPIQLPPFSSLPPRTVQAAGPRYVSMPAGFGALELARGPARRINGVEQVQKVEDETRKALERHYNAYIPGEDMMESAKRVAQAQQESKEVEAGGQEDAEKASDADLEQDGAARE